MEAVGILGDQSYELALLVEPARAERARGRLDRRGRVEAVPFRVVEDLPGPDLLPDVAEYILET